jgi:hypothetical protein
MVVEVISDLPGLGERSVVLYHYSNGHVHFHLMGGLLMVD